MKYNLLCFQISGRHIIFFNKNDYQVQRSLMKESKRYKRLKTAKWISIRWLVPGLLLTVRSAGCWLRLNRPLNISILANYDFFPTSKKGDCMFRQTVAAYKRAC